MNNNQSNQYTQQPVYQQPAYPQPAYQQVRPVQSVAPQPVYQQPAAAPAKSGKKSAAAAIIICAVLLLAALFVLALSCEGSGQESVPAGTQDNSSVFPDFEVQETPETNNDVPDSDEFTALSFAQIAAKLAPSVVTVDAYYNHRGEEYVSQGSGFIISEDGYIVTNAHVIDGDKYKDYEISVIIHDGEVNAEEHVAAVIGYDVRTDIAVLKIDATGLPAVDIGDSTALVKGDEVVAIGNPGGSQFAGSITTGVISGIDRILDDSGYSESAMRYLQTDAAISPGNSGGPLVNIYGQVIGINSVKIVDEEYENLGFAIPMATAMPIIEQLIRNGSVERPALGISLEVVSEWAAQWQDIPVGVRIRDVDRRSSLYGQVEKLDIIVECDGEEITTISSLQAIIESKQVGDEVELKIYRPGEGYYTVTATLIASTN